MTETERQERLHKVMAEAGVASRRRCEEMIREGMVRVNGHVVTEMPVLVDPQHDTIMIGRRRLHIERRVYYLLNKPKNVLCTNSDPQGRKRTIDLLTGVRERVYPVGRLDADSQGLVVMTNDGELANQLTHPRYGVLKTYVAEIAGSIPGEDIEKLKTGIHLDVGKATAEQVRILQRGPRQSQVEITLREGRNRQIRRMLARLGHPVRKLTRTRIGKLTLHGLGPGSFRPLTGSEVAYLQRLCAGKGDAKDGPPHRRIKKKRVASANVTNTKNRGAKRASSKKQSNRIRKK